MATTRKKKQSNNTMLLVLGAAGAGALYLFMRPDAKAEAIKAIVALKPTVDAAKLQTMDENYLVAWAYALTNKIATFPGIGQAYGKPSFVKFLSSGGTVGGAIALDAGYDKVMAFWNKPSVTEANQLAFGIQLINAVFGKK
jgi:hypothetical protein